MQASEHDRAGSTEYRVEIDSLRALAVLAVLLSHWRSGFAYPMNWGHFGVYTFFVISGYVISISLMSEKTRNRGRLDLKAFYLRRGIRIWPAYFLLIAYLYLSDHDFGGDNIAWHLFFLSDLLPLMTQKGASPVHLWSLSVEQQFYLLWPLCIFLSRRAFLRACLAMIAVSVVSRFYFAVIDNNIFAARYFLSSNLDCLAAGGLLAALDRGEFRLPAKMMRAIGIVGAIALGLIITANLNKYHHFDSIFSPSVAAMLTCWLLFELRQNQGFARAISVQPLLLIGKLSYGIYLYHLSVGAWVAGHVEPTSPAFPVVAGIITLALAFASWHLMEQPLIALGKRIVTSRWRRPQVEAPGKP